jgi:isopenicillin-N epimerase
VALTDSTTLGAALVYGGLKLGYGDEIITTNQDYYITHESLRRAALRNGSVVRASTCSTASRRCPRPAWSPG